jgi:hypothetical protein
MSIAQQVATPSASEPARHRSGRLDTAPKRRPIRALLGISGLIAVIALGLTLTLGTLAVVMTLVVSNLMG